MNGKKTYVYIIKLRFPMTEKVTGTGRNHWKGYITHSMGFSS